MKQIKQRIFLLFIVNFCSIANAQQPYINNTIVLKIKPAFRNECEANAININEIKDFFQQINVIELKKIFPHHLPPSANEKTKNKNLVDFSLLYQVKYSSNTSIEKAIVFLSKLKQVAYAEPHYIHQACFTPNDPQISQQFYHNNLQTFAAWNISTGDTNVVIGITDTGFDTSHVDLKNSVKKNYADPINGIDDDNDNYVDNFIGWDMANNDNNPIPDPCQICNHGVHVAGIASATPNNAIGIAGTGYNCKFLPIKIADATGNLTSGYEGIVYAADHNCKLVNCSWGGFTGGQFGQDAVNYATFNKNCLVVAAAGNQATNQYFYPAAFDNVFSIAATDSDDVKWSQSNFGNFIDVCAPGKDILSTWPGNIYVPSSGTSMACPAAAGCAAIVASHFTNYNALQIAERIKNTCDYIDTIGNNIYYPGKLGHGRINLYRALTDAEVSAMVTTSKMFTDGNDNAFESGDTINLRCIFTNYLGATNNVIATLRCNSGYITIIDSAITFGSIANMQDTSNYLLPFKFIINSNCPLNFDVLFNINFTDANVVRNEYFNVRTNVDYINLLENDLGITITSKGLLGYNNFNSSTEGIGVTYNGAGSMLYEGGLMVGNNPFKVSDYLRGAANSNDTDFTPEIKVQRVIPSSLADAQIDGVFNDNGAGNNKLNIKIKHSSLAWSSAANLNYIIVKYKIINNNNFTLSNLFAGIFADWDIMNYSKNRTRLLSNLRLSYAYTTEANPQFAGIKLLSDTAFKHFAIDVVNTGSGAINLSNDFNSSEKYIALSTNRDSAGFVNTTGNDIADVVSAGPYSIFANDSIEIAFAIIGGLSEQEIINGANAAQLKYDGIITDSFAYKGKNSVAIYPNPCSLCMLNIRNYIPDKTSVKVYDIIGNEVLQKTITGDRTLLNFNTLTAGVYIAKVIADNETTYSKFVVE